MAEQMVYSREHGQMFQSRVVDCLKVPIPKGRILRRTKIAPMAKIAPIMTPPNNH